MNAPPDSQSKDGRDAQQGTNLLVQYPSLLSYIPPGFFSFQPLTSSTSSSEADFASQYIAWMQQRPDTNTDIVSLIKQQQQQAYINPAEVLSFPLQQQQQQQPQGNGCEAYPHGKKKKKSPLNRSRSAQSLLQESLLLLSSNSSTISPSKIATSLGDVPGGSNSPGGQKTRGRRLSQERLAVETRAYKCSYCEWQFVRKEHVDRHMRIKHAHQLMLQRAASTPSLPDSDSSSSAMVDSDFEGLALGERFACPFCEHCSSRKDNLRKHVRNSHPERPLPVDLVPTRPGPRGKTREVICMSPPQLDPAEGSGNGGDAGQQAANADVAPNFYPDEELV